MRGGRSAKDRQIRSHAQTPKARDRSLLAFNMCSAQDMTRNRQDLIATCIHVVER